MRVTEKKQIKRSAILQSATELFVMQGITETSMQQIVTAAGIAKGTIYKYYASKEELIEAVYRWCHEDDLLACEQGVSEQPTATAKLYKRMQNGILWAVANPQKATMEMQYYRLPSTPMKGICWEATEHYKALDAIIREGVRTGEFTDAPSEMIGEIFFGLSSAYYRYFVSQPEAACSEQAWVLVKKSVEGCLSAFHAGGS